MDLRRQVAMIDQFAQTLATDATAAGLTAPVPSCPGWDVRELVTHVRHVHRWATGIVANRLTEMPDEATVGAWCPPVSNENLIDDFVVGAHRLIEVLTDAPEDLACFSFLPAPSPRAFWARRQLHETVVHAADARAARAMTLDVPSDVAIDGIDELLFGFATRPRRREIPAERTLALDARDTGDRYFVTLSAEQFTTTHEIAASDCLVAATASNLYLQLWNRPVAPGALGVIGDVSVLAQFSQSVQVRWR